MGAVIDGDYLFLKKEKGRFYNLIVYISSISMSIIPSIVVMFDLLVVKQDILLHI